MATTIGAVTGMPANGATGVNPATALVATASVADSASGFAMLEVQVSTENTFTSGLLADVESLDVVAPTATPRSVTIQLNGATRDAGFQPFGQPGTTVWNESVGTAATYSAGTGVDARVTDFASDTGGTMSSEYPVFFANATDPLTVVAVAGTPRSYQIPLGTAPSASSGHGLVVISPDHTVAYETTGTVIGGGISLITGNLLTLADQDVESTVGTWFANHFAGDVACTVARSGVQAFNGSWSLGLTATAAGACAQTGDVAVTGGTGYTALIRTFGPVGRNCTVNVQWKIGGVWDSNVASAGFAQTGGWISTNLTATAPAGAGVTASVYVDFYDSVAGDVFYLDLAYLGTNPAPTFGGAGWTATKWAQVDLVGGSAVPSGNGAGWDGVRGCGASALAGMLREEDRAHGSFPHALAVGLSLAQLTTGAVWPASADPALTGGGSGTIAGNLFDANTENLEATIGTWFVNTNCMISRDGTHVSFGSQALKVASTAAGAVPQTATVATSNATAYTAIAQVWAPAGVNVLVGVQEKLSGTFVGNTFGSTVTGNGTFQQISLTVTTGATAGGTSNQCSVFLDAIDSTAGTNWWVDSVYLGVSATPGAPAAGGGGTSGHNVMGELVAVPQSVTLSGLGLTANGLMVATALQKYGGYVVGVEAGFRLYTEPGIDATFLANLNSDMHLITAQLRVVTNASASLVGLRTAGAQGGGNPLAAAPNPLAQIAVPFPTNITLPTVTGTAVVGTALIGFAGTWSAATPPYAYQWRQDQVTNIPGATTTSYTPVIGDAGHTLDLLVTASNGRGSTQADSLSVPGPAGGTVTGGGVGKLIADMVSPNLNFPDGDAKFWSFGPGPELDQQLPDAGWTGATFWGVVYQDHDIPTTATNTRIQFADWALWCWSNSQGQWVQYQSMASGYGGYHGVTVVNGVFTNQSAPARLRAETLGYSDKMDVGYWTHVWANQASIPANDIGGAAAWFRVRLIVDNPAGVDDRAQCNVVASCGSDWYRFAGASWAPGTPDGPHQIYWGRMTAIPHDGSWLWVSGNSWAGTAAWGGDPTGARLLTNPPPFPG